jgi:hypothetical protein
VADLRSVLGVFCVSLFCSQRPKRERGSLALSRSLAGILLILLSRSPAVADQTTGTLHISVPATAAEAPAVTVASDREPERRWTAQPEDGSARVTGLPPGTYRVELGSAGGLAGGLDVTIEAGEVVSMWGQPAVASGGWDLRIVDRHRITHGTHFNAAELRELPAGSGLWGLLDAAAPFVIVDRMDTGGLGLGLPGRVGSRGASWAATTFRIGEFRAAEGAVPGDHLAAFPDLNAFEAVTVISGAATPDVATPGATVTLVPRRPGLERRGALDLSLTPSGLVATNGSDRAPSIERLQWWRSAAVQYGGPVLPRVGFFVTGSASALRARARGRPALVSSSARSVFGHVVANAGDRTQVRLLGSVERVARPSRPWRASGERVTEQALFVRTQAAWERQMANGSRFQAVVGVQHGAFDPTVGRLGPLSVDRVRDGLVPGPIFEASANRSELLMVFALPAMRRHALEVGMSLARSTSGASVIAAPPVGELVDGLAARVWQPEAPGTDSRRKTLSLAGYVRDRIQVRPDLTLDAGLRLQDSSGSAAGAGQSVGWRAALPRVAFRWTPRLLTVFAGYGRYQQELPLELLAFGDPGEPLTHVYRWTDLDGNGLVGPDEQGQLIALAGRGPDVASIDPALRAPSTDEVTFGAERRLTSAMTLSVTGTVRRQHALPRSVNVGAPFSSYAVRTIPDEGVDYDGSADDRLLAVFDRLPSSFGEDRFLLTNVDDDGASYEGLEIAWRHAGVRWWSFAGASAYQTGAAGGNRGFRADENDQGVTGELFEHPNAASYARGRLFFDRAYVLKWATGYHAPGAIDVAVMARYQDGQPFSRLVVVPDLAQGPEAVPAYANGLTRFTFTATVDARLEKRFTLGRHPAALRVELYNLTNLGLEVEEHPVTGPDFRRTTAVQPPRTVRLGFRVEF